MSVYSLSVGLRVRRGDRVYRLERHLEDGTLVFVDEVLGRPLTMTVAELWREQQAHRLRIVSGDKPAPGIVPANQVLDISTLPEKHAQRAARVMKYAAAMRKQGLSRGMRRKIEGLLPRLAQQWEDPHPPSSSAVMEWMRRLDQAHGSPIAAVSGHMHRKRSPRKQPRVLELARSVLRSVYCTRKRLSLAQTLVHIEKALQVAVTEGQVKADEASISPSTLRRLKHEIDPYQLDVARYGTAYARNKWRYSLSGTEAIRAMQTYEVDHTVVDLVAVCDRTGLPLGRPTITVVVDSYSGYVAGFFISFWGTGLATTFSALRVALSPKDDYIQAIELKQRWIAWGLPECFLLDNGLEFHSPQFIAVAMHLAMDLQYCAVRQPWLKPHVERCLGAYLHYLPTEGRVRKTLTNEVPLRPDETAAITFSDLCRGLLKAFVEVHAMQINERKLARPYDLFAESLDLLPAPTLPTGLDELNIIVAPSKTLTIGNEGVVSDYLRFNSPELQNIRRRTAASFKTLVKFNPEDLGSVWVQDPRTSGWLQVPSCTPEYNDGLSLMQHRAIRAQKRGELNRRGADATLLQAKSELLDLWQSGRILGKRLKTAQVRALAGLTSSHSFRPEATGPSSPISLPPPAPKILCVEDLAATPREVPEFDTFVF